MSSGALAPTLSDKELYRTFARVWPPSQYSNIPKVLMIKYFRWKKVAIILESIEVDLSVSTDQT